MNQYKYDVYRYYGRYNEKLKEKIWRPVGLRYIKLFRKANSSSNFIIKSYYRFKLNRFSSKTNIQIPSHTKIGRGFYIGHSGGLVINPNAVLGNNINIANGVTIGQENRGKRKGVPTIGNDVWIGTNAVIVGNIKIGNDVLIAPLSYVNFDVPDHSIVIGNPARIISRDNAVDNYVNRKV